MYANNQCSDQCIHGRAPTKLSHITTHTHVGCGNIAGTHGLTGSRAHDHMVQPSAVDLTCPMAKEPHGRSRQLQPAASHLCLQGHYPKDKQDCVSTQVDQTQPVPAPQRHDAESSLPHSLFLCLCSPACMHTVPPGTPPEQQQAPFCRCPSDTDHMSHVPTVKPHSQTPTTCPAHPARSCLHHTSSPCHICNPTSQHPPQLCNSPAAGVVCHKDKALMILHKDTNTTHPPSAARDVHLRITAWVVKPGSTKRCLPRHAMA